MSETNPDRPLFIPGGVAEPTRRFGYVAGDVVEAIDLLTGELVWRAGVAGRPVMVHERRIAALQTVPGSSGALRMVVLDTQDGQTLLSSSTFEFPDWVNTAILPNEFFSYQVSSEDGALLLTWQACGYYSGGANPSAYILEQAKKEAAGIVRVDLQTGTVTMLPPIARQDAPSARVPPGILMSYQMGASAVWQTEPWAVGDKLAIIAGEIEGSTQSLNLFTWRPSTSEAGVSVPLVKGQALVSYVTPDGLYVLIHSEAPAATPSGNSPWWVFSAETGSRVTVLDYEPGTREACILDTRLFYLLELPPTSHANVVQQAVLKLRELNDGKLLWERSLAERLMQAPPPPRP